LACFRKGDSVAAMFVYVGAITAGNMAGEFAQGISVLELDQATGKMTHVQTVPGLDSPSFLAIHPTLPLLYAGERHTTTYGPGQALSGDIPPSRIGANGHLELIARQPPFAATYLNLHPPGRYLFTAMPAPHCVMAFPIDPEGRVGAATSIAQHEGQGV